MEILIRPAADLDVRAISRLQHQWAEEGSAYGFVPESEEQIKAALGQYFLVAEINKEITGFISGSIHINEDKAVMPEGASYLEVDNLYILPEYRRQSIASGLITRLLVEAKEQGAAYALLYSAAKDIHNILRFYEQHNFRSWYVQMFREL
ncbi:MAG TPA: GNAT family N-acetyltransferase [Pyrinomonadaceae bacterium]|nr:GNAT family N-acetyltransferase [Pyrinomonadaceae bacterium]